MRRRPSGTPPSKPRRPAWRRVLRWTAWGLAGLLLLAWLSAAEWSPLAHALLRAAARRAARGQPGVSIELDRGGVRMPLNTFTLSRLHGGAGGFAEGGLEDFRLRYRLFPLLLGRVAIERVTVSGIGVHIDTRRLPPPAPRRVAPAELPAFIDRTCVPTIDVTNVVVRIVVATGSNAPPCTITVTNADILLAPRDAAGSALPFRFRFEGSMTVDDGRPAALRAHGEFGAETLGLDGVNANLDISLRGQRMTDLNGLLGPVAPFLAEAGELDGFFSVRCRAGRLAGLASVVTRDFAVTRNPSEAGRRFLQLSLDMWQFLVRERSGRIEADCELAGTLARPVVPIGPVLAEQAGAAGRNLTARLLDKVPIAAVKGIGERMEERAAERGRHDDILKIDRYAERERHYERARHYEQVVRNYGTAVEEYARQVADFPEEEDLCVKSLAAMAELQAARLDAPDAAQAALRRIVDEHRAHPDADDAMLRMIALAIERRDYPAADRLCREFGDLFPTSGLREEVGRRRGEIRRYVW